MLIWLSNGITTEPHLISPIPDAVLVTKRSCASDTPITSAILELSVFACFKSATNSEFAISRKLNVIVYETQQSADSDGLAFKQSIAKSKQCYVLLRIMRKIVKGKGKCDRQAVDAEFVIELDGEESKLFKEMFAELLK